MNLKDLTICAPARIHFGLFCGGDRGQFGGMGVMVREPATVIRCRSAQLLDITGKHRQLSAELVASLYNRFRPLADRYESVESLPLAIEILTSAPRHAGFGTGTQMALALATAVFCALDMTMPSPEKISAIMNRGRRSAIGTHGFFQGGCLIEQGRPSNDRVAELDRRIEFPCDWPVVLIRPRKTLGMHGSLEADAFQKMRRSEASKRSQLLGLCQQHMIPSLLAKDYRTFSKSLFEFNRISGEYFSEIQNGPYNGPVAAEIVEFVREFGIHGVGQSSWGPCIFAIAGNDDQAGQLVRHLRSSCAAVGDDSRTEIVVTCANNSGAEIIGLSKSQKPASTH